MSQTQYFYQSNVDLNKALEYVNKAILMTKAGEDIPFWYLRQKSLIQAKLGDKVGMDLSVLKAAITSNEKMLKLNE